MAVKWPLADGNWSNAANWNDGTKPTTGDTVHADGKTVTIDENVDLGAGSKLTTETRSGGTAAGGFTFSGDYTITVADLVSNVASACLTYTGSGTGAVVNAYGTASFSSEGCNAIKHTGSGTLTVVGGGQVPTFATLFNNAAGGTFNITGNVGNLYAGYGAANKSTGTLNLTGVASAGPSAQANFPGAINLGTGTLNITGNPISTSAAVSSVGALNSSTGTMTVTPVGTLAGLGSSAYQGNVIRNASTGALTITGSVAGSAVNFRATVLNQSTGAVVITGTVTAGAANLGLVRGPALRNEGTTRADIGTLGDLWAVEGGFYATTYPSTATTTVQLESTGGDTITLYAPGAFPAAWSPAPADVRYDVDYEDGTKTGTCYVPPAASVALNVPVDDAVGTLAAGGGGDPAAIAQAVWEYTTRAITGGTVDTLTNSPDVPTEAEIAAQVRLELATELATLDAAISSRLASTGYTAPDNAGIAAIQVKTDLLPADPAATADLAPIATRLAQTATLASVAAQLAAAAAP